jgi:hypothetical protein
MGCLEGLVMCIMRPGRRLNRLSPRSMACSCMTNKCMCFFTTLLLVVDTNFVPPLSLCCAHRSECNNCDVPIDLHDVNIDNDDHHNDLHDNKMIMLTMKQ